MRQIFLLSLLIFTLLLTLTGQASAQSSLVIETNTAMHNFGGTLTFTLSGRNDADIIAAALLMRINDSDRTDIFQAKFTPGKNFKIQVVRDLQAQPIPPFAIISYSWRLTDTTGRVFTTIPDIQYLYDDNRFSWQVIERGPVVAHWYNGDLAFGQYIADTGYQALDKASRLFNAPRPTRVDVYVYATINDLQSGLRLGGRTWVAGHADPKIGMVMVAASPDSLLRFSLERDVPHELMHIITYQLTRTNYDRLPVWLDEGLAVNAELQPRAEFAGILDEAAKADRLIALSSLCGGFNIEASKAELAYAESASVVRYLLDRHGTAKVKELLDAYRDGATCEGGVQRVLNLSLVELQTNWQRDTLRQNPYLKVLQDNGVLCVPLAPVALIIALLVFVPRKKQAA